MATTTTNYGFDVPTSSDLVKNGATAISTLGQDLDTFLFRPFTRNAILNSSMNVWQRGTSIACSTTAYSADRWQAYRSVAGATVSRQATGDTTNLPNIQYCARVQRDSGNTSTATIYLAQTLETVNSIPFAGKQITFSFYARKGANFSDANHLLVTLQQAAGTDQNVLTSMASSTVVNVEATLTTTWQRFTGTATVLSTTTQLGLYAEFVPVGTAGAADYFEITGVQLEVGNQVSPYAPATPTYATELAACQRYFQMSYQQGVAPGTNTANGANRFRAEANTGSFVIQTAQRFIVPLRSSPTFTWYSTAGTSGKITNSGADLTVNGTYDYSSTVSPFANTASSITAGNDVQYHFTASAEL